jgi:MYXO-CTERM domain-containing protein
LGAASLFLLAFAPRVSAHGPPPAATELLAKTEQGAALVRLTPGGFAHRVADGFRFICPEAWGGDVLAPLASISLGPTIVASDSLSIVEQDGRVALHPVQSGAGIVAASHRDAVFVIFKHEGKVELRRVTGTTNELVRLLDQPFGALVASVDELSLLRWLDNTLVLQKLSLTGEPLGSVTWTMKSPVAYARLRLAGSQLYVVVWGRSAPWVSLGRLTAQGYEPLREASTDVAGPVSLATGTLVAIDGVLQSLETGALVDTLGYRATCLGERDGLAYACAHSDLLRVDASGLGAPLFEVASLRAPDAQALSEVARADCTTRWLDLQNDIAVARAASAPHDAGASAPDAATADASTPLARASDTGGCSTSRGTSPRPYALGLALVAWCAAHRRRRTR